MKDVETMLSKHAPKPARELQSNFTEATMAELQRHRIQPKQAKTKTMLRFFRTIPGLAVITAVVSLGGVGAYAANVSWNDTEGATVTLSQTDPTIVTLDLNKCNLPSFQFIGNSQSNLSYTLTATGPTQFKILQPNKVTAQQVKDSILSFCERQSIMTFYNKQYPTWFPQNKPTPYQPSFGKITALTSTTITIAFVNNGKDVTATYPLSSTLPVYKNNVLQSTTSLHVGDNATFILNYPGGLTEVKGDSSAPTGANSKLASIAQMQYDATSYDLYEATNSEVFMPLSLYNANRPQVAAMAFYRQTYPAWFEQGTTSYTFYAGSIKSVTDKNVTITIPWANSLHGAHNIDITYPIQGQLTVYANGKETPLSSLTAGQKALFTIDQPNVSFNAIYWTQNGPSPTNTSLLSIAKL